jgi:CRISPR type I-E-associated protein CasB/Cse2
MNENAPPLTGQGSTHALVGSITNALARMPAGDVASLRRLRPENPHCSAFWKLLAGELSGHLPDGGTARDASERRWAAIIAAMANANGLLVHGRHLGSALANVVPEARVLRLLRAHGEALADAVRVTVHHLASRGVIFDATDLALLVLSDGRGDEEAVRRRIYRDFYIAYRKKENG